ncbi:unnamed protein product, partial [Prunus brigantina]
MVSSLPMNNQQQNVLNIQQGQNSLSRATAINLDHVLAEDVTEVARGSVLRPNKATSLKIQQLIRVMETSNQLNHQRIIEVLTEVAQTIAQIVASHGHSKCSNERKVGSIARPTKWPKWKSSGAKWSASDRA